MKKSELKWLISECIRENAVQQSLFNRDNVKIRDTADAISKLKYVLDVLKKHYSNQYNRGKAMNKELYHDINSVILFFKNAETELKHGEFDHLDNFGKKRPYSSDTLESLKFEKIKSKFVKLEQGAKNARQDVIDEANKARSLEELEKLCHQWDHTAYVTDYTDRLRQAMLAYANGNNN